MNKRNFWLAIIISALAIGSSVALAVVGIKDVPLFIVLLVLLIDVCCFPCAYMHQVDSRLQGKFNLLEGIPAHAGLLILFFVSPYYAVLYILGKH